MPGSAAEINYKSCMKKHKYLILLSLILFLVPLAVRASDFSGWAWSENIGWISFNSSNCDSDNNGFTDTGNYANCPVGQPVAAYKVEIAASGELSGYAYSEFIGWISFNQSDTGAPPSDDPCGGSCIAKATPSGRLGEIDVYIEGWARALGHDSSWDGWIRFDHGESGEVYVDSGYSLHGWAYTDNIGWISFNSTDPGAGGVPYEAVIAPDCDCSDCSLWTWSACGYDGCGENYKIQVRECSEDCCPELGDGANGGEGCTYSSDCYDANNHTECSDEGICEVISGAGTDECGTPSSPDDGLCEPIIWKWWETIARQLGG